MLSRFTAALVSVILLASVALGQSVTSLSFQVAAPAGAVFAKIDIVDEDTLVDDVLGIGLQIGTITGGTYDSGDLATTLIPGTSHFVLRNEDGCVAGGAGSSGEATAEIYLVITFYDAHGNQIGEMVETSTKPCSVL
jgi:hypothetical protein